MSDATRKPRIAGYERIETQALALSIQERKTLINTLVKANEEELAEAKRKAAELEKILNG